MNKNARRRRLKAQCINCLYTWHDHNNETGKCLFVPSTYWTLGPKNRPDGVSAEELLRQMIATDREYRKRKETNARSQMFAVRGTRSATLAHHRP